MSTKRLELRNTVAAIALIGGLTHFTAANAETAMSPAVDDAAAQAGESDVGIGEIVVTAQKRAQNLNDVGITIAVSSGEQLKAAGVVDVAQLAAVVPSFTASTSSLGSPVFSLRGINFNSFQRSAPPAVATYIDEAPLPYPQMTQAMLLDVERIEALKGPQGTLFGQNATAGSINAIAAKPTSTLAAGFQADLDSYGQTTLQAYISGPVSSTLRARLAAGTTQGGGWQRGYFLNTQKNGAQDKGSVRLLLDWEPTDRLRVTTNFNASYDRSEQLQPQIQDLTVAVPANASPNLLLYATNPATSARDADFDLGLDTRAKNHMYQGVLRADYEITDNLTLTSLTNYIDWSSRTPFDNDGSASRQQVSTQISEIQTFTQEVRLTGQIPSAQINYVFGASYANDDIVEGADQAYYGYSGFPANSPARWIYDLGQRATAVFGNVDFEVSPGLTLTGGARYTETRQKIYGCLFDRGGGGIAGTAGFLAQIAAQIRYGANAPSVAGAYVPGGCSTADDLGPNPTFLPSFTNQSQKENNVSWRAGVNYKLNEDGLLYGLVSRGYKAGTYPVIINFFQSGVKGVKQEQLTSYEIGAKLSFLDRRVQFNVAGFYYDYKDKQFFSYQPVFPGLTTATLLNIPKSKVKGIDAELITRLTPEFTLRGAITYIKTEVGQFSGFDFTGAPFVFTGSEFNFAPPVAATADAEYRTEVRAGLKAFIGGSLTYNDRTFADLGEPPRFQVPGYTLLDARIGMESDNGWRVSVWGRNLTDKYYWNSVNSGGDESNRVAAAPRTFGITFGVTFQ